MAQVQPTQAPTQTAKPVQAQPVAQPAAGQPVAGEEKPSIFKKWWFWLIFVVLIAAIGVGIYFLVKG